ncbi:hypothetical protein BCR33DRAFT_759125 [Rhizoclosmatium globosum]|uniref:Chitobiosyldiphosphodolichol beta-mannosyltransferase n=1 Tax=Rhizoclosmatium globosum TaxID=329046 RepID=A0A1Y2BKA5_9FUNG|nr:hypothetical protein BCR33DRAFT_759125 [Rhizoclosmatium globosum]|eukprot:ORY35203.1 hypothetical protein BCR33DRAFT_759125 [Rhizoclosmatium globosum]
MYLILVTLFLVSLFGLRILTRKREGGVHFGVLVLGDVGHSPRINLHALSMANKLLNLNKAKREGPKDANGLNTVYLVTTGRVYLTLSLFTGITHLTHLIGYKGSKVADALTSHPLLRIHSIAPPSKIIASNPVRCELVWHGTRSNTILIRWRCEDESTAIPTLIIAQLLRLLRGTKLIIDWHNFGFSIMALGKGESNKIVNLQNDGILTINRYEITFGRYADAHLCVTKAMAHHLKTVFRVKGPVIVLYDRAPSHFHRLTLPDTSWTPDEDFSILLDALVHYDTHATPRHKNLVIVVTGKGPLKAHYLSKIPSLNLSPRVKVLTAWLTVEDYPKLLGAADLGVCLHTSSSGLDLPMKVVDMFGCGLPVAAVTYPCLAEEMVVDGVNGVLVRDGVGLGGVLLRLFDGKSGEEEVEELRKGTEAFQRERWDENWERCVGGLVV